MKHSCLLKPLNFMCYGARVLYYNNSCCEGSIGIAYDEYVSFMINLCISKLKSMNVKKIPFGKVRDGFY